MPIFEDIKNYYIYSAEGNNNCENNLPLGNDY